MMAKVDLKVGTSLVARFDGTPELLEQFVDSVELFKNQIENDFAESEPAQIAAANITLAKFVKTRLSGAARQAVPETNDIDVIIAALNEKCNFKITSDSILAKLKNVKQESSVENLCMEVNKLVSQLKLTYTREGIPSNKSEQIATKSGIEALINGIKN